MPEDMISQIKRAIKDGKTDQAKEMLKPILQKHPTADAWTLAALVSDTTAAKIKCLKKALALDEWHSAANRMLSQLEQVQSAEERGEVIDNSFQREYEESQNEARQKGSFLKNLFGPKDKP